MAELVDALDSKSNGSDTVRVRFPLRPPEGLRPFFEKSIFNHLMEKQARG